MKDYSRTLMLAGLLLARLVVLPASCVAQEEDKDKEPSKQLVVELLETTYRFQNDGTGEITQAARLRVLTQAARDAVAQVYFSYSSQLEDLRIEYFRTLKKDGSRVDVDPSKAMEIAPQATQAAPTFSDVRAKAMVASQLEVGDALEYRFERIIRIPLKPGDFWGMHYPDRGDIVKSERVVLDVPSGRSLTLESDPSVASTREEKNDRKLYRWEFNNPKPQKESDSPPEPLFVVSTLKDWTDLGEWYRRLQAGRMEATPEIRALAVKLTEGKNTPRERLEAIYNYVTESVRYVALEFGTGGYQAHPASDVLHSGYGDCKDKAGLLGAMLEAVGMKSYPALVRMKQGVVQPAVAAPVQFDHVISAVPLDGKLLWLDPTFELAPVGLLASDLRGKKALLVEANNSHLETIPEESPVPERLKIAVKGKLDASGKIALDSQMELRGNLEVLYRRMFRSGNQDVIKATFNMLAAAGVEGASAETPESSDPTDLRNPFSFHYKLTRSGFFGPLEKSKEIEIPHLLISEGIWKSELSQYQDERQQPGSKETAGRKKELKLGEEGQIEESLDLELDPGYQAELPLPVHADRSFAFYDSTYTLDHGHVKTTRVIKVKTRTVPAERWQELASFQALVDADLNQKLMLRRTGPFDIRSQMENLSADDLNEAGARALDEKKDFALARDVLVKATEKAPKHKWAWNNLGRAYLGLGMIDEAERAFKKQIEINPDEQYAHTNLGRIYAARGQYEEAIVEFKKQLEINPLDTYAYPNLADIYSKLERWNDAAGAWKKAGTIEREKPEYLVGLAHALIKAGNTAEAREQLDRAIEKDHSAMMLNNVAYELADAGMDLDKAEQQVKSAIEQTARAVENPTINSLTPERAARMVDLGAYLDTLGWVYFQKGQIGESRSYLEAAYNLLPGPVVAEHLARVHARQGDFNAVMHFYACGTFGRGSKGQGFKELQGDLARKFGGEEEMEKRVGHEVQTCLDVRRVSPAGNRKFAWPPDAETESGTIAQIAVLVDEHGLVTEAKALSGDEPFRSAALADAKQVHLPPIRWPGEAMGTVRAITFTYSNEEKVNVFWSFGEIAVLADVLAQSGGNAMLQRARESQSSAVVSEGPGGQPSTEDPYSTHLALGAAFRRSGAFQKAITEYREAVKLAPNAVTGHRALADTLEGAGDRKGAIAEYKEVARLDPNDAEIHFLLGSRIEGQSNNKGLTGFEYDAKTKRLVPPKGWKPPAEWREALEEYRKAHELEPGNVTYKTAYERLASLVDKR